ncbi:hypothetical protein IVB33_08240 [Bradyrhizobium sp. 24]|uniref:hypothetical protein n=1 Tax=unclassified Bradyrhizobium TaxID=2631580 RepID=UPI001FFAEBF2|nr:MULTISPECIES: hypothetical protein [unclassified Bradyrhizobium]MCK1298472.1 hypothetical protein [Bradyrhizobium sp. 37]MCK1378178.1 hypothetical protein [Bradyrhizobium sp. 24]MCK1769516.1 hypothetical protein [Bradyrhizobium sp. 134]
MKKAAAALFASFKTSRAIPCSRLHRRDFMIQSTLDAGVRAIEYHPMVVLDDHVIRTDAIVLDRDDGRFAIDFVDARPPEDPRAEGLLHIGFEQRCSGIIAVTAADVGREPRLSAAREVWFHAGMTVTADDRAHVLDALDREGPVPMRSLQALAGTRRDPAQVVYALACEGSLSIDLRRGLEGRAIVRGGGLGLGGLRYGT